MDIAKIEALLEKIYTDTYEDRSDLNLNLIDLKHIIFKFIENGQDVENIKSEINNIKQVCLEVAALWQVLLDNIEEKKNKCIIE